ncbi:NACHT domain-containing protein [Actinoplanes sp. NPDC051494]|uniref:NACHT domain-containing protein n=1 Tax=Actinoplanes sp. NPDC051494 TaxID=3363907 RepID=UPI0037AEB930
MPKRLTYADAVKLLDGSSPLVKAADNLLGGALALATAGGSEVALGFFDAKAEVARLGQVVAGKITDQVRGLGRYDRSSRLQAAHGVLVVTAFFDALDDCLARAGLATPDLTRADQLLLVTGPAREGWLPQLLDAELPVPAPDRSYDSLLRDVRAWCDARTHAMINHLGGLAEWDEADDRARRAVTRLVAERLPDTATERYDAAVRRLSVELPEFATWLRQLESRAAARGLESLEAALREATSDRVPSRQRRDLATAYREILDRAILGGDAGEVIMPSLAAAYIDPRFRVKAAGPGARPAEDEWWDTGARADFAGFLVTYLTTPQAAEAPLLLLGQPGAGKSTLTRILAARLPAADFLVVRVALREVGAEAEIQDQIEQAVRGDIGETVAWADLARDAAGAMPVILLDGFDELLQATGIHRSDYLQRVAAFQHREATLGRPVAVVVTSRVAVADRARLPAGGLAVRLEPFDEAQLMRWCAIWNETNAGRRPFPVAVPRRFPDLAAQPLLLLMLALYDATGDGLQDESLDTGQLYERLLSEFAAREVRRMHADSPDGDLSALVEAELLRLSVVAFAMFHRLRLWVTTAELDHDLAGLGLEPLVAARAEDFRAKITAGQEMVGRFFFIQRAKASQDDRTLQTYEFLHATFGEYLIARLVVQAVRDAAARSGARTLRLGPADDDDLLQSLLGFTPLTARATVLPFVTSLLRGAPVRDWLAERLRAAVTRPGYVQRRYQPVDKRADHWMATYSFNLMLLTLACGGPLRASELFRHAENPASWLRDTALQWRAAVPGGIMLDSLETIGVTRGWAQDGRRDLVLEAGDGGALTVDPVWSRGLSQDWSELRTFDTGVPLRSALKSMQLSGALSEDVLRHAVEPVLWRMPAAVATFVRHGAEESESVAHSLMTLLLASAHHDDPGDLLAAYLRARDAVIVAFQGDAAEPYVTLLLRSLTRDAARLPADDVLRIVQRLMLAGRFDPARHAVLAVECFLAVSGSATAIPIRGTTELLWNALEGVELTGELLARVRADPYLRDVLSAGTLLLEAQDETGGQDEGQSEGRERAHGEPPGRE